MLESLRIKIKTNVVSNRHNNLLEGTDNKMDSSNMKPFRSGENRRGFERVQKELIKYKT